MHSMTKDCKREEELSTKKVKRNFKCAQITFSNQLLQRTWYFKLEFSQPNYIDFGIQGVLDLRKMAKPMHTPIPRVKQILVPESTLCRTHIS